MTCNVNFIINNYLSLGELQIYQDFEFRLQSVVVQLLNSSIKEIETAHLIFDIMKECKNKELQEAAHACLFTLLNHKGDDLPNDLQTLLAICKKGCHEAFFKCVSTKKKEYYKPSALIEIIHSFNEILSANQLHTGVADFPCYNEGGQELLFRLKSNSNRSNPLSIRDHSEQMGDKSQIAAFKNLNAILEGDYFSFQEMRSEAVSYLTSISEKNRSLVKNYLNFFNLLEDNPKSLKINLSARLAVTKLILAITSNENQEVLCVYSSQDFYDLFEEICKLYGCWGEDILLKICRAPGLQKETSVDALMLSLKLLNALSEVFEIQENILEKVDKFAKGKVSLNQLIDMLELEAVRVGVNDLPEEADTNDILKRFEQMKYPLSQEQLVKIKIQYLTIRAYCENWKTLQMNSLVNMAAEIQSKVINSDLDEEELLKLIAIGRLAIRAKFLLYPYNTQILTLLGLLSGNHSCIAEVKTGEGKSVIVALLAFVMGMRKKNIHVISSSRQLAIRDQKKYMNFFKSFDIQTSHICEDNREAKYFQSQILYGTASDFQFAVMREMLFFKQLFPGRLNIENSKQFDLAIIDEVDNLTIDTALNNARLSFPAEESDDWVYFPIYQFVQKNFAEKTLNNDLDQEIQELRCFLQKYGNGQFSAVAQRLSDDKLRQWIQSAHHAIFMLKEKDHYIVEHDKSDGKPKSIFIVDQKNTGDVMYGSRWSNGIHEFVEVKHDIEVKRESLMPLSLSNAVFYQMYTSLFGLTGTLGSAFERETINEIYSMHSFDVPTHKPSQRIDRPLRILESDKVYFESLINTVKTCRNQGRPILILCDTIQDSELIKKHVEAQSIPCELLNGIQQREEDEIIESAGKPGAVTIATNVAGRGTDIILRGASEKNGGLHVLLTFYPASERVEYQARGRSGRQGQPGSSEIILLLAKLNHLHAQNPAHLNMNTIMAQLKQQREEQEGITKCTGSYRSKIEHHIFGLSQNFYTKLHKLHQLMNNEKFLKEKARLLSDRFLNKEKPSFHQLSSRDRVLAEDFFKLLKGDIASSEEISSHWRNLLKQVIKRIINVMIHNWSLKFYQQAEKLVLESKLVNLVLLQEDLKKSISESTKEFQNQGRLHHLLECLQFSYLESHLKKMVDQEHMTLIANIDKLFHENEKLCDKYLSEDGAIQYIRDITTLNLKDIKDINF